MDAETYIVYTGKFVGCIMEAAMKKVISNTPIIFSLMFLFFPTIELIARLLHYNFTLYDYFITMGFITLLFSCATILMVIKKVVMNKINALITITTLPVSIIISGLYYLHNSKKYYAVFILIIVLFLCLNIIIVWGKKSLTLKIVYGVISLGALFLFYSITCIHDMYDFGSTTVTQKLQSPAKTYIAEVFCYDEGALGGDSVVVVKEPLKDININLLVGELFKDTSKRVYSGRWGDHKDMIIEWKDEKTLIINGDKYSIED